MRIFVASSSESRNLVDRILPFVSANSDFELVPWYSGVVQLSKLTLEGLLDEIPRFDGALFVLSSLDRRDLSRGEEENPRENIYFELGLAIAHLGRHRILVLQAGDLSLASDLSGLTTIRVDVDITDAQATALASQIGAFFMKSIKEDAPRGMKVVTAPSANEYNSDFYDYLAFLINHPLTQRCQFSGGGFDLGTARARVEADKLISAMRAALSRGVDIERVHTGGQTSVEYAEILEELATNPDAKGRFSLYLLKPSRDATVSDIFLINAGSDRWSVAELMIETSLSSGRPGSGLAGSALFVFDSPGLVRDLSGRFALMRENSTKIEPADYAEMLAGDVNYFSYGSNMAENQMCRRIPAAERVGPARLEGYRLAFDQPAKYRGGSVANVRAEAGSVDWGVVWRVPTMFMPMIDSIEDLTTYDRVAADVATNEGESLSCQVYVARQTVDGLLPEEQYLTTMLLGAVQAGFPNDYLRMLRLQKTLED